MANMVETLASRLEENLPLSQLAWGKITQARQITALLPLLTENYDLSNDVRIPRKNAGRCCSTLCSMASNRRRTERTLVAAGPMTPTSPWYAR